MSDTYSQIYIHLVFAVKGRENLISPSHKDELYKYMTGIVTNEGQKLIAINGMPNHVHILIGLKPAKAISDLVRDIKSNSSRFVTEKKWVPGKFEWQKGFGAFSYGQSQLPTISKYIANQEEHHKKFSFKEEYTKFLQLYEVDYKPENILEDL